MSKRSRRTLEAVVLALLVLMLLGRLPSYSYVSTGGPTGNTVIEVSGPGPHSITVVGADGSVAKTGVW